jgi:hypothetical protein
VELQKKQSAEAVEGNQDLTARVLDWARDRTEALEGSIPPTEPKPSPEAKASEEAKASQEPKAPEEAKTKTSPRVAVIALDEGAHDRGEVHLFEDLQSASRYVETLLEDGLDERRLAVFNCAQVSVHLSYRAVVRLNDSEAQEDPTA